MKVRIEKQGDAKRAVSFRVETEVMVKDAERGIIVMAAYPDKLLVYDLASRLYRGIAYIMPKGGSLFDKLLMPTKVVAVARCVKGDTYDEEKGLAIVREKLAQKLRRTVNARFCILADELETTANELRVMK